jgi:hypothetical protein
MAVSLTYTPLAPDVLTVRVDLDPGSGKGTTTEYTFDVSDGSELGQRLAKLGPLGAMRAAYLRSRLSEYASYFAVEAALDANPATRFSEAEEIERATRRPNQPKSTALEQKLALRESVRAEAANEKPIAAVSRER